MTNQIDLVAVDDHPVFRVGFPPDVWRFTPWEYASSGKFDGRWDDPAGGFRVLYAADSLRGCFMELLAQFRPDLALTAELDQIREEQGVSATAEAGTLPHEWARQRRIGSARLTGVFCSPTSSGSVAWLRAALSSELDAGTLRDADQREVTQRASASLWEQPHLKGLRYCSRFGDDETLWAVFERGADPAEALHLCRTLDVDPKRPELVAVLELFGITLLPPRVEPPPIVVRTQEEAAAILFADTGGIPTVGTSLGASCLWCAALRAGDRANVARLSYGASFLWRREDYSRASSILDGMGMLGRTRDGETGDIVYVFWGFPGLAGEAEAIQFFGDHTAVGERFAVMTMLRLDDGSWRVAMVNSGNRVPQLVTVRDSAIPRVVTTD